MKTRSIAFAVLSLAVMPFALAQPASKTRTHVENEPPALEKVLANTTAKPNMELVSIMAVTPAIPLGPLAVLKGYENEMTLVAQRMSAELANIAQGVQTNQITREQAEYLIQERYQVAMMQHQVLSALHDALEHDMAQAAVATKVSDTTAESDTTVVVEPPFSVPGRTK